MTAGDLTVTTGKIASGSGPGATWYLGVQKGEKAYRTQELEHDLGIVYSYGLDQHGINTVYGFTDSTLTPPQRRRANHRSCDECNFSNFAILNLLLVYGCSGGDGGASGDVHNRG